MKDDEYNLLKEVYNRLYGQTVRVCIEICRMDIPRAVYILNKWTTKGWYDYGVNVDLGWLTDKGKEEFARIIKERESDSD